MTPIPTDLNLLIPPVAPSDYQYFSTAAQRPQFVPDATVLNWVNAWWLAECSLLAYCDAGSAKEPLDDVTLTAEFVEVDTNQAYVIWDEQKVIVAFRGTDFPTVKSLAALADSVLDWSRDLDVSLERWSSLGEEVHVHAGFLHAASQVFQEIQPRVSALTADGKRTLWLTGHSLGGALATLCAQMFNEVQGVYVFGSPRVGDTAFAAAYSRPLWRFCNDGDVVVTVPLGVSLLPPFLLRYKHAGKSIWFDAAQVPSHRESPYTLLDTLPPQSVLDHAPVAYSVLTWNQILW